MAFVFAGISDQNHTFTEAMSARRIWGDALPCLSSDPRLEARREETDALISASLIFTSTTARDKNDAG